MFNDKKSNEIQDTIISLTKPGIENSLFVGQLLYDPKLRDKSLRGTIPLFWHSLNMDFLYQIYFTDCLIYSFFNPGHIITEVQNMGFSVYTTRSPKRENDYKSEKSVEHFDLFYPYITNFLMHESFIIQSIQKIEKDYDGKHNQKMEIIPQQRFE